MPPHSQDPPPYEESMHLNPYDESMHLDPLTPSHFTTTSVCSMQVDPMSTLKLVGQETSSSSVVSSDQDLGSRIRRMPRSTTPVEPVLRGTDFVCAGREVHTRTTSLSPPRHAQTALGRQRLASIIARTGAPTDPDVVFTEERVASETATMMCDSNNVEELVYPVFTPGLPSESPFQELTAQPGRTSAALALSWAITEELAQLESMWSLGAQGGGSQRQKAFASILHSITKRVERVGVVQALTPLVTARKSPSADCARLEAELAATESRLAKLKETEMKLSQACEPGLSSTCQFAASICSNIDTREASGLTEQNLQRLMLVELWLQNIHAKIEDMESSLVGRQHEALLGAFKHLPRTTADTQHALAALT